jgi:hypothetical protein
MVATEPTVEAVMMCMNELAPAFVELTARRRQMRARAHVLRDQGTASSLTELENQAPFNGGEGQVELLRRSVSLTTQSAKSLAAALLALRDEMGGSLDQCRYEQLWQVQFGKMEPIWKQDIENLCAPPSSHLLDLVNRIFP